MYSCVCIYVRYSCDFKSKQKNNFSLKLYVPSMSILTAPTATSQKNCWDPCLPAYRRSLIFIFIDSGGVSQTLYKKKEKKRVAPVQVTGYRPCSPQTCIDLGMGNSLTKNLGSFHQSPDALNNFLLKNKSP